MRQILLIIGLLAIAGTTLYFFALSSEVKNNQTVEFKGCSDFDCYEQYYSELTMQNGVRAAFADLRARYETDSYVVSQCHPLSHVIGRGATKIYEKVADAYVNGDSFCWSGYYHGVMEGIISKEDPKKLAMEMDSICDGVEGKQSYSFDYYNCVHGLGHGVMYINNNELFDALEHCNNLKGDWEQKSCWSGAFMENVIVDNKNHFTKYLKPEEPLYPCSAVDEKYKETCYLMQTSYMLKVTAWNFTKVFELCEQTGNHQDACYRSLGRDASGSTVSDVDRTIAICMLGRTPNQREKCVEGAVKDFISYLHDDTRAKQLCGQLISEMQATCLATVADYYRTF